MTRRTRVRCWLATLGIALTFVTSCTSSGVAPDGASGQDTGSADRPVRIVQPGRPGEPSTSVEPDDVPSAQPWSHADVAFVQMMVPHHDQALEMSRLAESRASDERVRSLARRIRGAQGPEIITLASWLEARNIDVPKADEDAADYDHGAHGHGSMAGMLTDEQMGELRDARGRRFDRLFLTGMIVHHEGAVAMAQRVAREGTDQRVAEMAADVVAGQSAEIDRMRELLRQL